MIQVLAEIRQFCDRFGMTKSAFGKKALQDRSLVTDLENGRKLRPTSVSRVRRFIKRNTPKEDKA